MKTSSIQIQSVLYGNEKYDLHRALISLGRAVEIDRDSQEGRKLGEVTVCYGDASPAPIFSDAEIDALREEFKGVFRLVYTVFGENTGSAKGHNRLGETCGSDYMMIMNPDVIVCPRFFAPMLAPFEDPALCAGMTEARQTPIEHPKEYDRETFETDWATTACAIFPTELFRKLNGFDSETFFLYCDDLDFSWRLRLLDKKIYYRPDSVVFHAKTLSAKGGWQPTSAEVYYSAEANLMMAYKWSNNKRFENLYHIFSHSPDETFRRAAAHFDELRKRGKLPAQIDPEHKVAKFVGDNYTEHRFVL